MRVKVLVLKKQLSKFNNDKKHRFEIVGVSQKARARSATVLFFSYSRSFARGKTNEGQR
jgi:hypothetical protein